MCNMSISTLNIPECKPSEGESDIDKGAYEHWKDIVEASLNLINVSDERSKIGVFKIKAGPKLLEVLNSTVTSQGMPDENTAPYSNAISRLNSYFGSRTYTLLQRSKLMTMEQNADESNINFVRRVGAAAKLCGYTSDEHMEAIVRTITRGTNDSRIRILAHRNWVNQGCLNDLINLVRDREIEKSNEEEFQRNHHHPHTVSVAAVSEHAVMQKFGQRSNQFRTNYMGRWRGNGQPTRYRGVEKDRDGLRRDRSIPSRATGCWRCGSIYHLPSECPVMDKVCRFCERRGHIARVCSERPEARQENRGPLKRSWDETTDEPTPKVAVVKKRENKIEEENKVSDKNDNEV
ncbi:uncharacterized protein LOC131680275 [Topomyia yanbarensis]|uniref:uncharacterized protein LOC131680275 n=1 Tax=Topomyia yanbarensis TaxID=2498891 RepID=UPI00273AD726|nr:uncharacterized protein LOC131680275 [Topomyia yanbarensis]